MCVRIYVCVCVYTHVCACVSIYIYIYIFSQKHCVSTSIMYVCSTWIGGPTDMKLLLIAHGLFPPAISPMNSMVCLFHAELRLENAMRVSTNLHTVHMISKNSPTHYRKSLVRIYIMSCAPMERQMPPRTKPRLRTKEMVFSSVSGCNISLNTLDVSDCIRWQRYETSFPCMDGMAKMHTKKSACHNVCAVWSFAQDPEPLLWTCANFVRWVWGSDRTFTQKHVLCIIIPCIRAVLERHNT